jgi:hypothetical protein
VESWATSRLSRCSKQYCYSITSSAVAGGDDGRQFHRALGRLGSYSLINRLDKLGLG